MKGENEATRAAARSFEELHIYQRARDLTNGVYALTRAGAFSRDFGLADQIRRAAVSVMSNIAEGFERGTSTEFIQFLYIAKGSCGEVRAQLQVALDQGYLAADQNAALVDLARRTSGMISNFIAHLQRSDYRGEKFARPQRQLVDDAEKRQQALRAAQLVNIRAQQRHCEQPAAESTPPPPDPSDPSHLSHS
ncbi:MAG: four helix bundle protein [Verrucomicrobia bacterium]|jgi:four helix bundle protein|nr:four helix bundle protein [Verrucomicrobiota bacterium]NMD19351.1 four helix bundle protein [Verrucomicrobiota bacterium]OQC66593.1 MAG: hypothetical protein BWX48_01555 [Verrucomicrobia bacterium ADurb.Bin006]